MSHVTVSGVWVECGICVTCYGLWDLQGLLERCDMLRFLWFRGMWERVSHVAVSGIWKWVRKSDTCYGFWCLETG